MKALILPLLVLLLLGSCESEYNRRLRIGKELIRQNNYEISSDVSNELKFHAHISGNERAFFEDIDTSRLVRNEENTILITRFP